MTKTNAIDLGTEARILLNEYCRAHDLPHVDGNSFSERSKEKLWDFWSNGTLVATVNMTKMTVKIVQDKKPS